MEERKKNLCAMIPESLHKKVREEQEEWGIKLNEYMERILKDHFEKGEREMTFTGTYLAMFAERGPVQMHTSIPHWAACSPTSA